MIDDYSQQVLCDVYFSLSSTFLEIKKCHCKQCNRKSECHGISPANSVDTTWMKELNVWTTFVPSQLCASPLNRLLSRLLSRLLRVPHIAMCQDVAKNPVGSELGWCAGCDGRLKVCRCADIVSEDKHVS